MRAQLLERIMIPLTICTYYLVAALTAVPKTDGYYPSGSWSNYFETNTSGHPQIRFSDIAADLPRAQSKD